MTSYSIGDWVIRLKNMESLENKPLDGGDMVQYVHAMLEERVPSKNILVNKY
jgi:hypothetical protein